MYLMYTRDSHAAAKPTNHAPDGACMRSQVSEIFLLARRMMTTVTAMSSLLICNEGKTGHARGNRLSS